MAPVKALFTVLLPLLPALINASVVYDTKVVTVEAPAVTVTIGGGAPPASTPEYKEVNNYVAPSVKGIKHKHNSKPKPKPAAPKLKPAPKAAPVAPKPKSAPVDTQPSNTGSDSGSGAVADNTENGYMDDAKFKATMLATHNEARKAQGAEPLVYDEALATIAANWAGGCNFEHSGGPNGENLASGATPGPAAAIKMWSDEKSKYTGGGFSMATGHYTQMVWKDTKKVGCGRKKCNSSSCPGWYVVCEYFPHGNVEGGYANNV